MRQITARATAMRMLRTIAAFQKRKGMIAEGGSVAYRVPTLCEGRTRHNRRP